MRDTPQTLGIVNVSRPGFDICRAEYAHLTGRDVRESSYLLDAILPLQQRGDWEGVARVLETAVEELKQAGATYAIIPANSVHFAYPLARFSLPVLNLIDIVADACVPYGRVGVLGVNFTMEGGLYTAPLNARGIEAHIPSDEERQELDTVIYKDLVHGNVTQEARDVAGRIARNMVERGCEALVLACTELPMVLDASTCGVPCIDSTVLLAQAAARY